MKKMTIVFLVFISTAYAQNRIIEERNFQPVIQYEYIKYQKLDLDEIVISGEVGGPGDLSIEPRYQQKFKNKLPYRKNFNPEIIKSVERVR